MKKGGSMTVLPSVDTLDRFTPVRVTSVDTDKVQRLLSNGHLRAKPAVGPVRSKSARGQ